MEMFWLFSVSLRRMGTVSFGMTVPAFVRYLLMLSSGSVECGASDVFGLWVREVIYVGYLWGSGDWAPGLLSVMGFVRVLSV